jgi:hypothetical protein
VIETKEAISVPLFADFEAGALVKIMLTSGMPSD